jgi:murein DD-endopeptidase MepM/ murein hydrolase activator NlpD
MNKIFLTGSVFCAAILCACDLQPKIASIPDSIGMFIEDRYPALLADPKTQPEIYNSAASDYGIYASPELYGSAKVQDYVLYASVDDYVLVPEESKQTSTKDDYLIVPMYGTHKDSESKSTQSDVIVVAKGDTVYSLSRKNGMSVSEFAQINNLQEPYTLSIGQKLTTRRQSTYTPKQETKTLESIKTNNTTRVDLQEVVVEKGDTLYSLSRKYEIPVNDLAVMNKLSAPFTLSIGQKIKVPKLNSVQKRSVNEISPAKNIAHTKSQTSQNAPDTKVKTSANTQKISSNPKQQLPKISARSASKFSWPVRGNILSAYGPKQGGLVNDGINIGATQGTPVKAAENGVVAYAGNEVKGMGNLVIVQHSDGWMTVYAHLDSMSVKRGTKVSVGQQIGKVGKTGKVDRPQLHFEIRKGTKAYNPTQYLKK